MREVEAAHAAAGPHGKALGELDVGAFFHVEQMPERAFLRVIGTRGVAGGGPDAAILFINEFFGGKFLQIAVAPFFTRPLVQIFGEGLGQTVGERLGHDGVVVVVVGLELLDQLIETVTGGHGESAEVISWSPTFRLSGQAEAWTPAGRDEVSERPVRRAVALLHLLTEEMKLGENLGARFVGVNFHVFAHAIRGEETIDRRGANQFLGDDLVEQLLRVVEELGRFHAVFLVLKNLRINAAQFPGVEERRPVDELAQRGEREVFQHPDAGELRLRQLVKFQLRRVGASGFEREQFHLLVGILAADLLVFLSMLFHERRLAVHA